MASASASSAAERVPGVAVPHDSKAAWAAWTARSTSAAVDEATSAMVAPVAGSITASVRPSTVSTQPPSMKFDRYVVVTAARSSGERASRGIFAAESVGGKGFRCRSVKCQRNPLL